MNNKKFILFVIVMSILLVAFIAIGLIAGQYPIQIADIPSIWDSKHTTTKLVLLELRLPRIICAMFIGALLAITGSCMQGIFRNPLVEPSFIGISAGAASAVVLFLVVLKPMLIQYIPLNHYVVPCVAFIGSVVTVKIVIHLASIQGRVSIGALLLSGIAVNAFCGALMGICIYFADDAQLRSITFWNLGSLASVGWQEVWILSPVFLIGLIYLFNMRYELDVASLGEEQAISLGIDMQSLTRRIVYSTCFIVGATVAFAGIIGFVGLLVPHITRFLVGANYKFLLIGSALMGSIVLLASDITARSCLDGAELPLGSITALLGAPFFIYQISKLRKEIL
tara:strand:- start:1278 stop:2294 length:1017 start_codon:yes stop_codon:yes gene_type:complete